VSGVVSFNMVCTRLAHQMLSSFQILIKKQRTHNRSRRALINTRKNKRKNVVSLIALFIVGDG
jgi:hypothetical protein